MSAEPIPDAIVGRADAINYVIKQAESLGKKSGQTPKEALLDLYCEFVESKQPQVKIDIIKAACNVVTNMDGITRGRGIGVER